MHEERQEQIKEHRKKIAKVIAKAWSDRSFKEKLFSDPKEVLEANGISLPTDLEVKVVEQTNKLIYVVIPFRPEDAEGGSWQCEDDTYDTPCIRCN
jgi:hypothetical protein